jgi:hypothetical protein
MSDECYRELIELRSAHSVRWPKPALGLRRLEPEQLDLEMLQLLCSMRHLLSSQLHRRFNPDRAPTTTQRRLKRLADAGLVTRFQFHRRDGGGTPMCYSLTPAGRELCPGYDLPGGVEPDRDGHAGEYREPPRGGRERTSEQRLLEQARRDVRVAGWVLALEGALGAGRLTLIGAERSPILPPTRSTPQGRRMIELRELALPGGRTPHDFLRTSADGRRSEVERFQSVRPDMTALDGERRELLVELDDRLPQGAAAAKLERYDHFLSGWASQLRRYESIPLPLVVFVCRDRARARECARGADRVLTAARAYPGEYPAGWEYPGRQRILFAAESDVYAGQLCAWRPAALPPQVRAEGGDPSARAPLIQAGEIGFHSVHI